MAKFVHIDGDDGSIMVSDQQHDWGIGWIYEVPDNFRFELTPENLGDNRYVYEIVIDHPDAKLVHRF